MSSSLSTQQNNSYLFAHSFQEFHDIFWNVPIGIFKSTPAGRFLSANPAWAKMCGYDEPQELIESVSDIATQIYYDPKDRAYFKYLLEAHGQVVDYEYRLRRTDGTILWVAENVRAVRNDKGEIEHYQGIAFDISKRKQAEKEVRASEERFAKAFRSSPAPQVISEINTGKFLDVNDRWVEMLGWNKEELIGRTSKQVGIWDDPSERDRIVRKLKTYGYFKDEPIIFRTKQGQRIEALWSAEKITFDGQELMLSMIHDQTERRQVERRLKENYQFLDTILDAIQDGISVLDPDLNIIKANKTVRDWYSCLCPLEGKKCFQVFHNLSDLCAQCPSAKAMKTGNLEMLEVPFAHEGSDQGVAELYSLPLFDDSGRLKFVIEYVRDITKHKQAEKALRQKNEEQALLLDCIPVQLWYLQDARTYGAVNQAHADFVGRPQKTIEFRPLDKILNKEEAETCIQSNLQVYATRKPYTTEEWLKNAQGERRLISITKTPKLDEAGNVEYVVCSGSDITEQRQYERELRYLSFHDQLTGLYNRVYLEAELDRLDSSRYYPITIICMDLDGLKLVNDTLGHEQGDNHLRACANILQNSFRAADIVARVGGDEFVALLPNTSLEIGENIVVRIKDAVDKYNQKQEQKIPLSLSLGLACAEGGAKDLSAVFKQADDLMYRDKLNRDINSRSQILKALMAALEERDFITSGHAHRLEDLCRKLGQKMNLSSSQLSALNLLAQVHDLGKVGIPDHILFKPGPLTDDEWKIMRQHPEKGYRIAQETTDLAGIADLILKHHERWDGKGYPLGLRGEDIPIECRILAIADSFDAMTTDRPYRKALPVEEALAELKRWAGYQFDPQLVVAFLETMASSG